MKKIFYITVFLFVAILSRAQTKQAQYPIELPEFNIGSITEYTVGAKVIANNVYEYTVRKVGDEDKVKTFTLRPNNLRDFTTNVDKSLQSLFAEEDSTDKVRADSLRKEFTTEKTKLDIIYYQFVSSEIAIDSHDTRPIAGKIYFGEKVSPIVTEEEESELADRMKYKLDSAFAAYIKSQPNDAARVGLLNKTLPELKDQLKKLKKKKIISKDTINELIKKSDVLKFRIDSLKPANFAANKKKIEKNEKAVDELIYKIRGLEPKNKKLDRLNRLKVSYSNETNYTVVNSPVITSNLSRALAEKEFKDIADMLLNEEYDVEDVEIEFNEGYIENIKVIAKLSGNVLKFENYYPIGFSTKRDYEWLYNTYLMAIDKTGVHKIKLSDVIERYEQKHEVDRRDYSPANDVVKFDFKQYPDGVVTVYKETTSKLFELKTFSDFAGFDQSSPNGLIQIELERRLNLRTRRGPFFSKRPSFGYAQFITPSLLFSKLEENNKHLLLETRDQFTNNQYDPIKFTSTLELKRYENLSVGVDLNLFLIDFPSTKLTFYFNSGFKYGRVAIRDSIRVYENNEIKNNGFTKEFGSDTYQITPIRSMVEFKTDERYSVSLAWSLNFYFLRDNYFIQVANIPTYKDEGKDEGDFKYIYHNVMIGAAFKPSSTGQGRLFFRYRYNWQQGFWRTGFHQAQVGYSVYLMKTVKP